MPRLRSGCARCREDIPQRGLSVRFLANENFPAAAIGALTDAGHDIVSVRTSAPGMSDPEVLAWAAGDERILLTFDKTSES